MKNKIMFIIILLLLTACSSKESESQTYSSIDSIKVPSFDKDRACPDAKIHYIDALMWDDIMYDYIADIEDNGAKKATLLGEINYTLANQACLDYKMKNGDATFLQEGTKIFAVEGYKSSFRVIAANKIYQARMNPNAKTVADVFDLKDKVTQITIESTVDGSHLFTFTDDATKQFIDEWLALDYVDFEEVNRTYKAFDEDGKQFLRIYLNDDTSFRIVYWTKENIIQPGAYGTDSLKRVFQEQAKTAYSSNRRFFYN